MSDLRKAARALDPFKVRELLLAGADANERSGTDSSSPLQQCLVAARFEDWGEVTVRVLLEHGADPNLADDKGRVPILDSVRESTMRLLLEAGAQPNYQLGREPAILIYARLENESRVRLLIEFGADPHIRTESGNSIEDLIAASPRFFQNSPEQDAKGEETVWEHSQGLTLSPEEYVSKHRDILIWGFHTGKFENPALHEWADRVAKLLADPFEVQRCYRAHLQGEELEMALALNAKTVLRYQKSQARKALADQYVATFGLPSPPFPYSHLVGSSSSDC